MVLTNRRETRRRFLTVAGAAACGSLFVERKSLGSLEMVAARGTVPGAELRAAKLQREVPDRAAGGDGASA